MTVDRTINSLLDYINESPTAFHAAQKAAILLEKNGFKKLEPGKKWYLKKGEKYYIERNNSAVIAFIIGTGNLVRSGFRLIAAHTDSPGFRIKPQPEIIESKKYLKLNTEVYGSPILNTWLDRPLSMAGRLSLKTNNPLQPKLVLLDYKQPLMTIPNLAIHLDKDNNKEKKINKQKDLLPLVSIITDNFSRNNYLLKILAEKCCVSVEDILDFDMYLYDYQKAEIIGLNNEFISAGRLDDLAMVHSGLEALINSKENESTRVLVLFDNEEIGSMTRQGAFSPFLINNLERLAYNTGYTGEEFYCALENSFIISADMAHAVHPNYPEKHDPTNKNFINDGPVIKISANQKYTSDSNSIGVCHELCRISDIPFQIFVNRSDQTGGSTIGPVSSSQLAVRSLDLGNPLLAMHSIRELAGVDDHHYIIKLFKTFFNI
ncbi:MAG: M18 family aminopeptidase [Halanaerobiaceae bacterium]